LGAPDRGLTVTCILRLLDAEALRDFDPKAGIG
jgi:hypothetical protein